MAVADEHPDSHPGDGRADDDVDARLLDAAREVLNKAGYENLKVQQVLRLAGLSTGAFYRRFGDKAGLMRAVLIDESERASESLHRRMDGLQDPAARVEAWIRWMVGLAFDQRTSQRVRLFANMATRPGRPPDDGTSREQSVMLPLLGQLTVAIEDGRNAGDFPDADPGPDTVWIYYMCHGFMTTRAGAPLLDIGPDEVIDGVVSFALAALRSPRDRHQA